MKKILWMTLLLAGALMASEIHWIKSYQNTLSSASAAKKPIVLVISSHNCKWCRHLEKTTFKDPAVIKQLNKEFVSITVYTDMYKHYPNYIDQRSYYPKALYRQGTPTIWFLDSKGKPLFDAVQGAIDAKNFLQALDIVKKKFDKETVQQ